MDDDDSHDGEPGWNITTEMRERIRRSAWLRDELKDGGLRSLIERIDAASDDNNDDDEDDDEGVNDRARGGGVGGGGRGGGRRGRNNGADQSTVSSREVALERARRSHPNFASFVDRMLLAAGVLVQERAWSAGGHGDHRGHLVLAPVPRTMTSRSEECDNAGNNNGGIDSDDVEDDSDDSGSDVDSDEESDSSGSSEGV
jgi:hypothetical protein